MSSYPISLKNGFNTQRQSEFKSTKINAGSSYDIGCLHTFTVPSALAVIISPDSTGWCSVQVMSLLWTLGGGFGCNNVAYQIQELHLWLLEKWVEGLRPVDPKPRPVRFRLRRSRWPLPDRNKRGNDRIGWRDRWSCWASSLSPRPLGVSDYQGWPRGRFVHPELVRLKWQDLVQRLLWLNGYEICRTHCLWNRNGALPFADRKYEHVRQLNRSQWVWSQHAKSEWHRGLHREFGSPALSVH